MRGTEVALGLLHSVVYRHTPELGLKGPWSRQSHLRGPRSFSEVLVLRARGAGGRNRQLRAGTYLGVVLSSGEERQLIGSGEVGSDLLHLPKTLPLPPLGPSILEPDLEEKAVVTGVRPQAGSLTFRRYKPIP